MAAESLCKLQYRSVPGMESGVNWIHELLRSLELCGLGGAFTAPLDVTPVLRARSCLRE